jgi:STE24 endopeptidase
VPTRGKSCSESVYYSFITQYLHCPHTDTSPFPCRFRRVHSAFDTALGTAELLLGYLPWSWALAGRVVAAVGGGAGEIRQSIAWVLLMGMFSMVLELPWGVYTTFVLEARHGFNKTTAATFVADLLKSS